MAGGFKQASRSGCVAVAAAGLLLMSAPLAAQASATQRPALAILHSSDSGTFAAAVAALQASGVRPLHLFPPDALIVAQPGSAERLAAFPDVREVYTGVVDESAARGMSARERLAAEVWNRVFMAVTAPGTPEGKAELPQMDALEQIFQGAMPESNLGCPAGAQDRMVSEFMLGSISLNVILPESTGAVDPSAENWDESREAQVLAGVVAGAQWLLERGPASPSGAALSFTYHLYSGRTDLRASTSYEPITRAADATHEPGAGEGLWTNQILDAFGYASYPDRWAKARAFDNDTRNADGTNWAVTLFVADSLNDPDGRFTDNRFAYTWQPGCHIVMTYDNSGWGVARMGSVLSHELCHAFWAKDEYSGSGCSCTQSSGYLNAANGNCAATCGSGESTCVMRSADLSNGAGSVCSFTARQIGWADADTNGLPDSVQAPPATLLDAPSVREGRITVTGTARVQAAPNQNPSPQAYTCSLTLAAVSRVQIRLNGGTWMDAAPAAGGFSGQESAFTFTTDLLPPAIYWVEVKAIDTLGQVQTAPSSISVSVSGSSTPPPIPDGSGASTQAMSASGAGSGPVTLAWDTTCPSVNTNLYWGFDDGLPSTTAGPFAIAGSECGLGTSGAFTWNGCPDPAPSRFVWWLLVATDGIQTEGSWGKNSVGVERNGAQTSGQCGFTTKDLSNPGCP